MEFRACSPARIPQQLHEGIGSSDVRMMQSIRGSACRVVFRRGQQVRRAACLALDTRYLLWRHPTKPLAIPRTFQVVGQLDAKYGCTPYKLEASGQQHFLALWQLFCHVVASGRLGPGLLKRGGQHRLGRQRNLHLRAEGLHASRSAGAAAPIFAACRPACRVVARRRVVSRFRWQRQQVQQRRYLTSTRLSLLWPEVLSPSSSMTRGCRRHPWSSRTGDSPQFYQQLKSGRWKHPI